MGTNTMGLISMTRMTAASVAARRRSRHSKRSLECVSQRARQLVGGGYGGVWRGDGDAPRVLHGIVCFSSWIHTPDTTLAR